jgi:hypothetical protein
MVKVPVLEKDATYATYLPVLTEQSFSVWTDHLHFRKCEVIFLAKPLDLNLFRDFFNFRITNDVIAVKAPARVHTSCSPETVCSLEARAKAMTKASALPRRVQQSNKPKWDSRASTHH